MVLATVGSGVYKAFLFLHILAAIVGFGGVMLNGAYAVQARKKPGREGLAIFQANEFVTLRIAIYSIYAVFVFGLITAIIGKPAVKFSQAWLSTAMLLYIIGIAISHAVMIPSSKKMEKLLVKMAAGPAPGTAGGGPPPEAAEAEALGKRLALFGGILNLLVIVVLFLMVVKPGLNTAL
jgi:uncharacterized membrane protein